MKVKVTETVKYVGVNDKNLDLFESQYMLENGMAYNSYIILDDKVAIMDTVDASVTEEWAKNVEEELEGRDVDFIVVQHMEPDHAGSLEYAVNKYPNAKIVASAKSFVFMKQFMDAFVEDRKIEVKEGDTLELGRHKLTFIMAPMVHWPEVMLTYESSEKILFSADAFGKFGTIDTDEDWACEARRYYFNIVGKYGAPVQTLLKKAAALDIEKILPLHGPFLTDNLEYYIDLYNKWSSYTPENKGVFVAYASIHGNTKKVAEILAKKLEDMGEEKVAISDLCREDIAECVEDAFRYDRMVLLASSYDGGAFIPMEDFLHHLQVKTYQNRKVALVENGTWAPCAAKAMRGYLETMKNITILDETLSIKSTYKDSDEASMDKIVKTIYEAGK